MVEQCAVLPAIMHSRCHLDYIANGGNGSIHLRGEQPSARQATICSSAQSPPERTDNLGSGIGADCAVCAIDDRSMEQSERVRT